MSSFLETACCLVVGDPILNCPQLWKLSRVTLGQALSQSEAVFFKIDRIKLSGLQLSEFSLQKCKHLKVAKLLKTLA